MTFTITLAMIRWLGLPFFVLSLVALLGGDLPDHSGNQVCNSMRLVVWPLMFLWFVFFFALGFRH